MSFIQTAKSSNTITRMTFKAQITCVETRCTPFKHICRCNSHRPIFKWNLYSHIFSYIIYRHAFLLNTSLYTIHTDTSLVSIVTAKFANTFLTVFSYIILNDIILTNIMSQLTSIWGNPPTILHLWTRLVGLVVPTS